MSAGPAKASARRVQAALDDFGLGFEVREFSESTRSAADAAAAIGCQVGQIAKSLVFRGGDSDRPLLVIASGPNRVDLAKVAALVGEPAGRADADFVRARTGFSIGGVPPLGHDESPVTLIDRDLTDFEEIWAAAGTPNAVFRLAPGDLARITGGQVVDVKQD
ncbi:MAG: YbaK/EbsC family protein [Pseudomonadota bacterium]